MKTLLIGGALAAAAIGIAGAVLAGAKVSQSAAPRHALEDGRDPGQILAVGDMAPEFEAKASDGTTVRLADLRGRHSVVLVFYPGNNTMVCTQQLCAVRDSWDDYEALDALVFGVNPASKDSHRAFAERHEFPFPLLVDDDGALTASFGARGIGGIVKRTVYAIGKDGRIVFAERGVPTTERILAALREAGGASIPPPPDALPPES